MASYAGRQFRLRGLAELIAETTTHHLDSDPQLNAWRWSTTEHDRLVAVAHPLRDGIDSHCQATNAVAMSGGFVVMADLEGNELPLA
ncbi:hypothetical protein [Promicromonospora sp. NPDC023987]|uniref:hypothetical protein n=1 Tax=Promicromonospora sp. NPDC023987 TaxID=3155360 RepID=UPI003404E03C